MHLIRDSAVLWRLSASAFSRLPTAAAGRVVTPTVPLPRVPQLPPGVSLLVMSSPHRPPPARAAAARGCVGVGRLPGPADAPAAALAAAAHHFRGVLRSPVRGPGARAQRAVAGQG